MASMPKLKRYTDLVLVCSQKCTYINLFIGHSIPFTGLVNNDAEYQLINDQMQLIVKDVQAPESITAVWLVDGSSDHKLQGLSQNSSRLRIFLELTYLHQGSTAKNQENRRHF